MNPMGDPENYNSLSTGYRVELKTVKSEVEGMWNTYSADIGWLTDPRRKSCFDAIDAVDTSMAYRPEFKSTFKNFQRLCNKLDRKIKKNTYKNLEKLKGEIGKLSLSAEQLLEGERDPTYFNLPLSELLETAGDRPGIQLLGQRRDKRVVFLGQLVYGCDRLSNIIRDYQSKTHY